MPPAYINHFKVPNYEFLNPLLIEEMNILNKQIDKYYLWLNRRHEWDNNASFRHGINICDLNLRIEHYENKILLKIQEIENKYNIKFNKEKLLYSYDL